jgi:flagellar biosynthetic protein FliR
VDRNIEEKLGDSGMDSESLSYLVDFYNSIDVFLIIMLRLLGFFILLPIFSGVSIPNVVKVGFTLLMAGLVFSSGKVTEVVYTSSVVGFVTLCASEFVTGVLLGFVVFLSFSAIYFAGQLIDYQIGFSMVNVFDPVSQIQVPVMGNLFYLIVCAMLVVTGGLNSFIAAIFYSYDAIVPGAARIVGNTGAIGFMLELITQFFVVGVKISMPIVGPIIIIDVVLGILVKAVPQMNIFVVGMPLKVLLGLGLLYTIISFLLTIYDYTFELAFQAFVDFLGGITP